VKAPLKTSEEYYSLQDPYLRYLAPRFKALLGDEYTFTRDNIGSYCAYLTTSDYHKMDLIFDYTPKDAEMCWGLLDQNMHYQVNGDKELAQIGSKMFLETLTKRMEALIDGESKLKLILNFSHDTTVSTILKGLEISLEASPPFASTIFFEMWLEDDSYMVRTLFNDVPQTFGHCKSKYCQFYTFKQVVMENVAKGTIKEVCKAVSIFESV
jgi:hypothetical protein